MSALNKNRILQIDGAILDKHQLQKHLENIAITHNLKEKSDKETYPIPRVSENYEVKKYKNFVRTKNGKISRLCKNLRAGFGNSSIHR